MVFSVYSHSLNLMAILLQCVLTRKTGSEQNHGMLVAPAYRVGDNCVGSVLAALTPSNPPLATKMDVNEFHTIYIHASESLLRATAKRLGVELTGKMHACRVFNGEGLSKGNCS